MSPQEHAAQKALVIASEMRSPDKVEAHNGPYPIRPKAAA
jgi:hypothetical protein